MISKSTNTFMNLIYEKVKLTPFNIFKYLSHRRKLKKFRKHILNCSPDFSLLWRMADFIKYAEEIFLYDNAQKNGHLYSSRGYTAGQNGFRITDETKIITVKLYSDTQRVILELKRQIGSKLDTSLSFTADNWDDPPSAYEEMLLEQLIDCITTEILKLFDECYNKRVMY